MKKYQIAPLSPIPGFCPFFLFKKRNKIHFCTGRGRDREGGLAIPLTTIKLRREQVFGVACVCPSVHCCTIGRGRCRGGQGSYRDSVIEEGKGNFPKVTSSHSSPNWLFLFGGGMGNEQGGVWEEWQALFCFCFLRQHLVV